MSKQRVEKYGSWAIVTGAARREGLGYAFARQLAADGFNLLLIDILEDELAARAQALKTAFSAEIRTLPLDLGQPDVVQHLEAATSELDVGLLICNHMFTPTDTPAILDMALALHYKMLDVNARAYTTLVHYFGKRMVAMRRGGIVIVTSGAALVATPYTGAYSANKAFQRNLGEALWYEVSPFNVDVLVVAAGLMRTQGDALDRYPQWMLMDVEPVVAQSLAALGKKPLLIPGIVNKLFMLLQTRLMNRRQALTTVGKFMASGLGK